MDRRTDNDRMLRRPQRLLAVVPDEHSLLPLRLEALGFDVSSVRLDWWLEPSPVDDEAAVLDLGGRVPPSLMTTLIRRGFQKAVPTVWITDEAPTGDSFWMETELIVPTIVAVSATDSTLEAAILTACRMHYEVEARREAEALSRQFQDLASRLSIGLFRYQIPSVGRLRVEYFSHRAQQLLDMEGGELDVDPELFYRRMLPEDRETYRQFVTTQRAHRRPGQIRIRLFVRGRVRTLLLRFDAPQPVAGGISVQGIVEDVTEETARSSYGERSLELLRELRDNLRFLDLVEPAPPPPGGVFSRREREVFQLVRAGLSNAQIGLRLECSESTVKKHVSSIYEKAGVHTRAQLLTVDWNDQ
jgi:DNA-binding CsgD family transcriptional regulator